MAIMEIKILPLGTPEASVSDEVAAAVQVLVDKGVPYILTAMGTILESDSAGQLFELAREMHAKVLQKNARVVTFIELDERTDKTETAEQKVRSAQEKIH
ncbi:MAG: MTH1187 family thiamine-binding protein [Candidatus Omnitrophota bacterium]